jgi:exonuclease III
VTGSAAHKTTEPPQGTVFSNTIGYQFQVAAGAADTEPGAAERGCTTNDYEFDIKAINCNSLNVACSPENFALKMDAICNIREDIIFLSDIRLSQISNQQSSHKVSSYFNKSHLGNYIFLYNSTSNKRGVAMLISKKLDPEIQDEYRDQNENILLIRAKIKNKTVILGSIYGPNTTDRGFYREIDNFLCDNPGTSIIIGGDWNVTWSNTEPVDNIDISGMTRAPNMANGRLLKELSDKHGLTDPFRVMYPEKKSYSYSPFGTTRLNRSRIDFFVVSIGLLSGIKDCGIFPGKLSTQFDHKPIFLKFRQVEMKRQEGLKSWFLEDDLVRMSTELAALQTYSFYLDRNIHPQTANLLVNAINVLTANITQCLSIKREHASNYTGESEFNDLLMSAKVAEHKLALESVPDWDTLCSLDKTIDDKEFFLALTNHVSDRVSAVQHKLNKYKNF